MPVDKDTVKTVAALARIAVSEEEADALLGELNAILGFVEQLSEVDVAGVEPMTTVVPMALRMRPDRVTEGGDPRLVLANAPERDGDFFVVPKVVE